MTVLNQLENKAQIIGKLQSKNLEVKTTADGRQYITGKLKVLSSINNTNHEFSIKVFSMRTAKTFSGLKTVMDEYKSIEDFGEQEADKVKVTGSLKYVQFEGSDGNQRKYNEIQGYFFTRINHNEKDMALLSMETIVESHKQSTESGVATLQGFTVGYNEEIIPIVNCIINNKVMEQFKSYYFENATGRLIYTLNSPMNIDQKTSDFGQNINFTNNTNHSNSLELIVVGGDMPIQDERRYTPEKIKLAKEKFKEKYQEQKTKKVSITDNFKHGNAFSALDQQNIPDF